MGGPERPPDSCGYIITISSPGPKGSCVEHVELSDFVRDPAQTLQRSSDNAIALMREGAIVAVLGASRTVGFAESLPGLAELEAEAEAGDEAAPSTMSWFE